jgi:hypothetical protein
VTYASEVSSDSPVAWWGLDETSGTTANDAGSGTAFNGTYTNTYRLGIPGIDGADTGGGTAVDFTNPAIVGAGTGVGHIAFSTIPTKLQFASGTAFSIEAWVAFGNTVANAGAVVTEAYAGDGAIRYMLGFYDGSNGTRTPSFGWYNGSWRLIQGSAITDTDWHHLVGTFDGTQLRLYVDGSLAAGPTTPGGTQPGGTEALYINRRWDSSTQYDVFVDEVAMYASELSSTRVSAHYGAYNPAVENAMATGVVLDAIVQATSRPVYATSLVLDVVVAVAYDPAWWDIAMLEEDELPDF